MAAAQRNFLAARAKGHQRIPRPANALEQFALPGRRRCLVHWEVADIALSVSFAKYMDRSKRVSVTLAEILRHAYPNVPCLATKDRLLPAALPARRGAQRREGQMSTAARTGHPNFPGSAVPPPRCCRCRCCCCCAAAAAAASAQCVPRLASRWASAAEYDAVVDVPFCLALFSSCCCFSSPLCVLNVPRVCHSVQGLWIHVCCSFVVTFWAPALLCGAAVEKSRGGASLSLFSLPRVVVKGLRPGS
ncbi:phosphatidylinositol-4-phosphate 5-kinase [Trypanosoma conorhini]|uniref:Phosphatidylinositol-4-phosphate 5-kinase n=1 Tax=Trypanosoma conorhini TaxID=83891 RepID=A0A422Q6S7_9TRYP|nr:phosphatidylinositol-4-phosphate 5-kinase [Trypanosoma conorhini]RNF25658.1 phosphatidylinositol-4-phosphate 5-kinase [Trypanosoma conorhini]